MQGDAAGWPNEVYCELHHELNGPSEMVKQDHLKYFRFHGRDWAGQLFDLDADPEENRNLIDDPACAAHLQRLHTRLDAFRRAHCTHRQRAHGWPVPPGGMVELGV